MGFNQVGQAGFELLTSGDLPGSASQRAGIIDVSHCAGTVLVLFSSSSRQHLLISALLTFGTKYFFIVKSHCRILSSIPGLYPLDAMNTPFLPLVITINDASRRCQVSPDITGGKIPSYERLRPSGYSIII